MSKDRQTQPFKNIRYANASDVDSDVQVVVGYTPPGGSPVDRDAYDSAERVPRRRHTVVAGPQLRLPDDSLIQRIELRWDPVGARPAQTLAVTFSTDVTDFETVMVTQGPDFIMVSCLAADLTVLDESQAFP
jgi:hypothetical protein